MSQVVVIGCGSVGLPLAVALASRGARVLGVDTDHRRVGSLNRAKTGLLDPGLEPALRDALKAGAIAFAGSVTLSAEPRAWVIATPTPIGADLSFDASALNAAFHTASTAASPGDLVTIRSTVPVGRTRILAESHGGRGLLFAACPDRSLAGRAFEDQFVTPNVVGGLDSDATRAASDLFAPLGKIVTVSSPEAAEALKLFANAWRDACFGLANQLALFSAAAGIDFEEIRGAGRADFPRFDMPRAGPVGGPCLTKDVHLLAQSAREAQASVAIFLDARRVNESLVDHIVQSILRELGATAAAPRIAILGMGFKGRPATRDRRGSIGAAIATRLGEVLAGADLRTWDPAAENGGVRAATAAAEVVVLANDHPALAEPALLDGCAQGALVYDLCGVLTGRPRDDMRVRRFGSGRVA